MTIDTAIREQIRYLEMPCPVLPLKVKQAMELGIAALRWVRSNRLAGLVDKGELLPGELEE